MAHQPTSRRPIILGAAVATVATGVAAYAYMRRQLYAPLPVSPHVDVHRYMGLWYEIARLPTRFEKGCEHVTARYRLLPNGKVSVLNTCHKDDLNGPLETAQGTARVVDTATNAKLRVSFFWPFEGDYWILHHDPEYRYALVGEPSRKNLWLLCRTPHLERPVRDRLVGLAHSLGFPTENLIFTPQPVADKP
ncbi:lipocalin family protein [Hymenobacter elongatus]|uniref:Lipocalin/cytosolic fatty-acid binding domain-containing protein n=1 Tax=Hymenobacter elongatus TaxID=877208 RepID=A0A4Z0PPW7_9BACT|nr:lipocalin family protein [Hymenobacter elongatus]TGE18905.1 hypothetical protein E5J99_03955 [Hymenobacter elongatus]